MIIDEIEFVKMFVTGVVDNPQDVEIHKTTDDKGILLTVFVNQNDMGMLIGRKGENIQSLRVLIRNIFLKRGKNIYVKLHDPLNDGYQNPPKVLKDIDEALEDLGGL